MRTATYHTISGANLLDNYKVHYYFDTYAGGASNAHVYSDGDSQYSGKIFAYDTQLNAETAEALDLFTGNLGTGTFSGGVNQFYDHVTITNSSDLFSGEFSFLISAQTTTIQEVGIEVGDPTLANTKGPLTNNNILFSNMGGSAFNYSGWQLGINAANRAYVECNHNFQPLITTYMGQQNPYQQNIWGLVYRGGLLKLGLYDINTESFSFESLNTSTANLRSTRPWIIGSGINYNTSTFPSGYTILPDGNSGLFAGQMNNFLYFNTGLTDSLISTVAQSLYSELAQTAPPIYDTGTTGFLFGHLTGSGISGEVGEETLCSVTGYLTATVGFKEKIELVGTPNIGDTYYLEVDSRPHPISGAIKNYRALYYTGGLTPPLVTGFTITNHTTGYLTPVTGCSGSGITGAFATGSGFAGSGISGFTGLLGGVVSGLSGAAPDVLKPNAFSYIGKPLQHEGVIEKYNMGSFGIGDKGTFNNLAKVGEATLVDGHGFYLKKAANRGSLGLYLNGVGRELGGISLRSPETSKVFFNVKLNKTFALTNLPPPSGLLDKDDFAPDSDVIKTYFNNYNIISGDYYMSGRQVLEHLPLPFSNPNILDIYDTGLNTGTVRSRSEVTSVPLDYTDTIQHLAGYWSAHTPGGSPYGILNAVMAATGVPTCWASGDDVTITWPGGAMGPLSAEISGIQRNPYDDGELLLWYLYDPWETPIMGHDINIENAASPCFTISGDQWVFFNGQKLVSGINYIDHPVSGFTPSGYITGITGIYFTIPPPSGTVEVTGTSLSFGGTPFFPNSNVIFINGVREDVSASYVEHTNTKDLISGKETLRNYGANLYNNR